jgi:2-C-methyl-D-erythritol 2,4-cyclodiphosphate synthase
MIKTRVGFGYDVHQLVIGRKLVIGGVQIPHNKGALGHSDADVLLHALADALLGAAGLEDIGTHFPDTDPKYKDIDSRKIVLRVMEMIIEKGFEVGNVDSTVVLQNPKIKDFIPEIKKQISSLLAFDIADVSVKAKTTEYLGFIGKEEGVAAYAVVLLSKKN